jgi:putative SOS response-associated peptidase YedK
MCGRYVFFSIGVNFRVDHSAIDPKVSYNIAPTQEIPVIIRENDQNELVSLHWGLVPFWAKDKSIGNRLINARIETIIEKPAFRAAFKKRRCLILANGFYEWKGETGNKQPYFITTGEPIAFAGIWETWDKEDPPYRSCAIITTDSAKSIKEIHSRMPVILRPEYHDRWLDPKSIDLTGTLKDGVVQDMKFYPVSTRVNKTGNNDKSLLDPVKGPEPLLYESF